MKKPPRPKPSRSSKSSKETTCTSEDEYETSGLNKEESVEDIDLAIAKLVKHPPHPLVLLVTSRINFYFCMKVLTLIGLGLQKMCWKVS
jgi:hypothetical protein